MQMSKLIHITHTVNDGLAAQKTRRLIIHVNPSGHFRFTASVPSPVLQILTVGSYIGVVCNCKVPAAFKDSH